MNDEPVIARIRLNPHSRDVQRDLRDATEMHRTMMRMVPDGLDDSPRSQTGLLYRLDETDTTSTLLVQANHLDPARLPARYGQADIKSLPPHVHSPAQRTGRPLPHRPQPCQARAPPPREKKASAAGSCPCPGRTPTIGGNAGQPTPVCKSTS